MSNDFARAIGEALKALYRASQECEFNETAALIAVSLDPIGEAVINEAETLKEKEGGAK